MKPIGLTNLQAATVIDQAGQHVLVVLALDHRGKLWQRTFHNGWTPWEQVDAR